MTPKVALLAGYEDEINWLQDLSARGRIRLFSENDVTKLGRTAEVNCFVVAQTFLGGSGFVRNFGTRQNPLGQNSPVLVDTEGLENFISPDRMTGYPRFLACLGWYDPPIPEERTWLDLLQHLATHGIGPEDWALYFPHMLFSTERDEHMNAFLAATASFQP